MLRSVIIALSEPGTMGMQEHMFSCIHRDYSTFCNAKIR